MCFTPNANPAIKKKYSPIPNVNPGGGGGGMGGGTACAIMFDDRNTTTTNTKILSI